MRKFLPAVAALLLACAQGNSWNVSYPYEKNGTYFFENIAKRTVLIQTMAIFNGNRNMIWTGSGAVIGANGTVLTANHVVSGPFIDIQVYRCELTEDKSNLICGNGVAGRVVRRDLESDIALIKMSDVSGLPRFRLARANRLRPGKVLWRVGMDITGWAAGPLLNSRSLETQLEILTPASGGASGGPVVDGNGALLGIVTSTPNAEIASRIVTFAVPIERIRRRVLNQRN